MEDKRIIKYNIDNFSKIACMDDFYNILGLIDDFKNKLIKNVNQIYMDNENCEMLNDFIKKNAKKDKRFKHLKTYKEQSYNTVCGMDWLNFCPNSSKKEIPKDEIWIFYNENKGE